MLNIDAVIAFLLRFVVLGCLLFVVEFCIVNVLQAFTDEVGGIKVKAVEFARGDWGD